MKSGKNLSQEVWGKLEKLSFRNGCLKKDCKVLLSSQLFFSSSQEKAGCVACKRHTWIDCEKWSHEYANMSSYPTWGHLVTGWSHRYSGVFIVLDNLHENEMVLWGGAHLHFPQQRAHIICICENIHKYFHRLWQNFVFTQVVCIEPHKERTYTLPKYLNIPQIYSSLENTTMKKPFLLSHKEQKAASTTRRSQKLGAVLTLLDEPQLIPRSQVGILFLLRYAQMSPALSTPLFAPSWTQDEPEPFK